MEIIAPIMLIAFAFISAIVAGYHLGEKSYVGVSIWGTCWAIQLICFALMISLLQLK